MKKVEEILRELMLVEVEEGDILESVVGYKGEGKIEIEIIEKEVCRVEGLELTKVRDKGGKEYILSVKEGVLSYIERKHLKEIGMCLLEDLSKETEEIEVVKLEELPNDSICDVITSLVGLDIKRIDGYKSIKEEGKNYILDKNRILRKICFEYGLDGGKIGIESVKTLVLDETTWYTLALDETTSEEDFLRVLYGVMYYTNELGEYQRRLKVAKGMLGLK